MMKKTVISAMIVMTILGMTACSNKSADQEEIIGGADEATTIDLPSTVASESDEDSDANTTTDANSDVDADSDADAHFLEYLKGNEADVNGETFWAVGEPDMEYALYDLNGDGINELLVRAYGSWIYDIILYKEGNIQPANVENLGSSGITLINDKNQFVSGDTGHEGRAMYVVSQIDDKKSAQMVMAFVNYRDDWAKSGKPEFYKMENPTQDYLEHIDKFDVITEAEYNALVEQYTKENTSIAWTALEADAEKEKEQEQEQEDPDTTGKLTEDQALSAIKNYCFLNNPELEDMVNSGEYIISWEVESSDEHQIVILYRSYTAALIRYYIDVDSGETYVTEFVQGITNGEEQTDERFNVKDYIK